MHDPLLYPTNTWSLSEHMSLLCWWHSAHPFFLLCFSLFLCLSGSSWMAAHHLKLNHCTYWEICPQIRIFEIVLESSQLRLSDNAHDFAVDLNNQVSRSTLIITPSHIRFHFQQYEHLSVSPRGGYSVSGSGSFSWENDKYSSDC